MKNPLQIIPGIGKSLAEDLNNIGVTEVSDLKGKSPKKLYEKSNRFEGGILDPCVLYTYRCAVYFAETKNPKPELLKWWNWKAKKHPNEKEIVDIQKLKLDKRKLRKLELTKNPFGSLVRSIIFQQLSTKSATAILNKFLALFPKQFPTPQDILNLSDEEFKSAGISPQKRSYLKDLALKFSDGTINHKKLHTMSEEEIREHLILVKGIGPWTIDMFLMFALNKPDVLPTGDLGIMKGFQKVFNLKNIPTVVMMEKLAEPYRGRRTYLSLYLWQSLDGK